MTDVDALTAERVARNDAIFRDANEKIRDAAVEYEFTGTVPFICECADESCRELLNVSLDDYERVRASPRLFLNAVGHDAAAGPHAQVAARHDGYDVVEKVGRAGEIVEQLDTRRENGAA